MPLVPCAACGRQVSDSATQCYGCGHPRHSPAAETPAAWTNAAAPPYGGQSYGTHSYGAQPYGAQSYGAQPYGGQPYGAPAATYPPQRYGRAAPSIVAFHPMKVPMLVAMSIASLGLYNLYWFYRNWKRVNEATGRGISPFWRALFGILWAYSLFDEVDDAARAQRTPVSWSVGAVTAGYILLTICYRLPDPYSILSVLSVLPLIPVQNTINSMAAARGEQPDTRTGPMHVALLVAGALLWGLVLIGIFVTPHP